MTVLCATTGGLPGIRICTHRDQHRVTCPDHEGWDEKVRPGFCGGCLPRSADRGYLCHSCYEQVENAYYRWAPFARLVHETEGRAVSPEAGRGSGEPAGYTNLPLTFLTLDECERLLASRDGRTLDAWVHTADGARDAIMFAHAAENAYRSLDVEGREQATTIVREKCPNCDSITVHGHVTREVGGNTIVTCQWCGHRLAKVRTAPGARTDSDACGANEHADCRELACQCACHAIGRRSRPQGVVALWNADEAAQGFVDRGAWVWDGSAIRQHDERKTA